MMTNFKKSNKIFLKNPFQRPRKNNHALSRKAVVLLTSIVLLVFSTTLFSQTPTPGHWAGTTNYGNEMSFDVSGDSTQWSNFKLKAVFFGGSITMTVTVFGPGSITNGEFNESTAGGSYTFSGEFTSSTTATGTYVFDNYGIYNLSQSGTWTASLVPTEKDDLLGTWTGQGVYYRNSDTGTWIKMASPASQITSGDFDDDGIDDLIGIWPGQGGVWVKYSSSGNWAQLSTTADWIAAGDMNGDGIDDLLGTWTGQGVYYRDSDSGAWVQLATPATQITTGDLDDDGTDDLIGIWPAQGGVWVKYSSSGTWERLSTTADWMACGDMNGDTQDDFIGTWTGQGVYYRDSFSGDWVGMGSPATQIAAGDLDGDEIDDLVGMWPGQGGVWVLYSGSNTWESISSTADWIACGRMRSFGASSLGVMELAGPYGGIAEGPPVYGEYEDLSSEGPGGWNFMYQQENNLIPHEREFNLMRIPGPGEPGFECVWQENLVLGERLRIKKNKKKK